MPKPSAKTPAVLAGWVAFSALLNCGGWILSAIHQLNAAGYACFLVISAIAFTIWFKNGNRAQFTSPDFHAFRWRISRGFPMAFIALTIMAVVGGFLYAPSNYDALSYRVPRILHWLAAGQWHWVPTVFNRLNTRAVGFEWLAVPLMIFTGTDRWLFLINVISFFLLPGLFFSILRRLGVRSRVAWHWMWLLPTGYCYLLQAGSIGNDMFGAVFGLAALDLALRARVSKNPMEVWLSALAVGLVCGSKLSNLPLALPWLIAILPSLSLLKRHLFGSLFIGAAAVVCSIVPVGIANYHYTKDWTGMKGENNPYDKPSYALHFGVNAVLLAEQNLQPSIFPVANKCNQLIWEHVPASWKPVLEDNFEHGGAHLMTEEMQIEEGAGLGFGISALLLVSWLAAILISRTGPDRWRSRVQVNSVLILAGGFIAMAVFMSKSGLTTVARIGSPYYGFVMPALLLAGGHSRLVRLRWWRWSSAVVFLIAALLLVLSPARPLWPAQTVLSRMNGRSGLVARAIRVYDVYAHRADGFAPVREFLPADAKVIGLISFDFPETSLWRPFGTRRVEDIDPNDSGEHLRALGIQYILVNDEEYDRFFNRPYDDWLTTIRGEKLRVIPLDLRSGSAASHWSLVRLKE